MNFYCNILGFELEESPKIFKNRKLCFLKGQNIRFELYSTKNYINSDEIYTSNRIGFDHISLTVKDINKAISEFKENNIKILKYPFIPPTNAPNQQLIAFIEGPDCQEIEIREADKFIKKS